jgi:hypothetical protein
MLGYSADELTTIKFRDLVIREKSQLALTDMIFNEKGEVVIFNGKVVIYYKPLIKMLRVLNCSFKF